MKKIVLASNNKGKLAELQQLLTNLTVDLVSQSTFNISSVEETGSTFVENAILKARHVASATHLPAIADDSGLIVDALNGAPGVYSARYAGEGATDLDNIEKLLRDLKDVPDNARTARFVCVLVLMRHENDPTPIICQGSWEGAILRGPQGEHGFGYDPIFYVPTHKSSSAQLTPEVKNQLSHRAEAMRCLVNAIQSI